MKNSYSNIFAFNKKNLKKTIRSLNNGSIVGLPTETVYGLMETLTQKFNSKNIQNKKKTSNKSTNYSLFRYSKCNQRC